MGGGFALMRRRLQKFLPIVLIALAMQVLAPIAACWATSIAASDPLGPGEICHSTAASTPAQSDQTGGHRAHDGACSICCVVHAGASIETPQVAVITPYREHARLVWPDRTPDLSASRGSSNAQARGPPSLS